MDLVRCLHVASCNLNKDLFNKMFANSILSDNKVYNTLYHGFSFLALYYTCILLLKASNHYVNW